MQILIVQISRYLQLDKSVSGSSRLQQFVAQLVNSSNLSIFRFVILIQSVQFISLFEVSFVNDLQEPSDEFDHSDLIEDSLLFGVRVI